MASTEPPPLITECPNCHTRFRVGESQLQIAHGRVRCGACLAVFAGVDHLLLDDAESAPELPSETNMLESVLAELAEEDGAAQSVDEVPAGAVSGATAARAFELDALATRRGDIQELELSGGFLAVDEGDAVERSRTAPELESAQDADWTSVSVDTQEFGPRVTLELASSGSSSRFEDAPSNSQPRAISQPRATIEDALNDEQALRWWLEDELPHEGNDFAVDDDDSMVVQLSELDMVRDEDDFDLRELLGAPEASSKTQLEALFRELRDDNQDDDQDALDADSGARSATETTPEQALRQVVSDLKADAKTVDIDRPEPAVSAAAEPPLAVSERSSAELHDAIDQAEPLVTRAMANGSLAASANKVAAAERVAEAEQAAARALARDEAAAREAKQAAAVRDETTASQTATASANSPAVRVDRVAGAGSANDQLAAGHGAELVEPPPGRQATQADGWNSATFEATPAELVENITQEMAAAGTAQPEEPAADRVDSALDVARSTLERWLGNPYALRVGTVLASVLLVGQVMFWQFDDWAKSPTLRPVYSGLCAVVGCELPLRRSVLDMQSRKLAVRSHPDKPDKLLVDALIINEAEFAQPFPIIELQFMDLNQQVVGSYRLEPSSYLDGELAGSDRLMAVRTPVHIDIEIADPGPTAVNYQLQFR